MAVYRNYEGVTSPLTGRFLAHNHHDPVKRAFLAADLHVGRRCLVAPTITQAAMLARVNRTYAFWAAKRADNRAAIEDNVLPLVPPRIKPAQLPVPVVDDAEIIDLVRRVGISRVLDAAVAVEAAE